MCVEERDAVAEQVLDFAQVWRSVVVEIYSLAIFFSEAGGWVSGFCYLLNKS